MKKNPADLQHTAQSVAAWLKSLPDVMGAFPVLVQRTGKRRAAQWPGALYFQRILTPKDSGAPAAGRTHVKVALYLRGLPPNQKAPAGKTLQTATYFLDAPKTAYRLTGDTSKLGGWAKQDWYLASYMTPAALHDQRKKGTAGHYHPFGLTFQLMPWRVPNGEPIDQYESKPYVRETIFLSLLDGATANPKLKSPVEFFIEHAGSSYDPKTETEAQGRRRGAVALAQAELWAARNGYTFDWSVDPDADSSEFSDEKPAWQLWQVVMRDPQGRAVESLGGVDFGRDREPWGDPYQRVVQAELALVHRIPVKSNPYATEHAARLTKPIGFVRVRRHNNAFGPGISAVYGIRRKSGPRGGRTVLQAIRFDAGRFTPAQARAWLRRNEKYRVIKFEPARGRQARRGSVRSNPKLKTYYLIAQQPVRGTTRQEAGRHTVQATSKADALRQAGAMDPRLRSRHSGIEIYTDANGLVWLLTFEGVKSNPGSIEWRHVKDPAKLVDRGQWYEYDGALVTWGSRDAYQAQTFLRRMAEEKKAPALRGIVPGRLTLSQARRLIRAGQGTSPTTHGRDLEVFERALQLERSARGNPRRRPVAARRGSWIICYRIRGRRTEWYVTSITRHRVRFSTRRARARRFDRASVHHWVAYLNRRGLPGHFRAEEA